ncbi:MAG: hypothetical protein LBQ70_01465 [Prevotellaceae bacterium]|jgi:hypothetical protein|nr:hypothetical protein [Prevotellaceae bacterium]
MTGFEVRFRDKVIVASIGNKGVLPVIISYCNNVGIAKDNNSEWLSISGLDGGKRLKWFSGEIEDVEYISIKIVDVEQTSEPVEVSYPDLNKELIEYYFMMKKELEEEGVL